MVWLAGLRHCGRSVYCCHLLWVLFQNRNYNTGILMLFISLVMVDNG